MQTIIKYVNPIWDEGLGYVVGSCGADEDIRLVDDIEIVKEEIQEVINSIEVHEKDGYTLQCPFCHTFYNSDIFGDRSISASFYNHLKSYCKFIPKKISSCKDIILGDNITAKDFFNDKENWVYKKYFTFPVKVEFINTEAGFINLCGQFGHHYSTKAEAESELKEYIEVLKKYCTPIKKVYFQCDYCGDVFINEEYAAKHLLNKHKKDCGLEEN